MNMKSSYSRCGKLGISTGFTEVLQQISKQKSSWHSDDISSMTKLWLNLRYAPYQIRTRDYLPGSFPYHSLAAFLLLTFKLTSEGKWDYRTALSILCPVLFSFHSFFFPSQIHWQSSTEFDRIEQVLNTVKFLQVLWKIQGEAAVSCSCWGAKSKQNINIIHSVGSRWKIT